MHVRRARLFPTLALTVSLALSATSASAQPGHEPSAADKETARKLLDDGDAAMAKKDFAGALKFYEGAHAIMNLPVTGYSVAQAEYGLGQYIEARDMALTVTRMPKAPGEPQEFIDARKGSDQMATKLDGMIPSLQVQATGLPADATPEVSIDGAVLNSAAAFLPRRVNPGNHHIEVKATGFATGTADVNAKEGSQTVPVSIVMKPAGSDNGPGDKDKDKTPEPKPEPGGHKLSILLPVGAGIAGGGLVLGIATGAAALATNKRGEACANPNCALGIVSDVGFVIAVGGAAVGVAGLVLTLTSHEAPAAKQDPNKPSVTLAPVIGPTYAGLRGTF